LNDESYVAVTGAESAFCVIALTPEKKPPALPVFAIVSVSK